jgi:acetolactate synthase-1/2/3 large subunit
MTNQPNGARFLAGALKHCGVRDVFFIDAILRNTLLEMEQVGIRRVLVHSEKTAAYMADGYARVSNRVGVCMAQSVGAANLAAGLQDAYLHRSPVLALTGRKPPLYRYRNAYQEIEHAPLFQAVTKMQATVEIGDQLPLLLAQALREATTDTPRPVHLDINGLQGELIEAAILNAADLPDPRYGQIPAHRPLPAADEIDRAAAVLAKAAKPVLVIGTGAIQAGAHQAVAALAQTLHIPIATSLGGRGIVATVHPLHIGVAGTYSAPVTNQLVHEADLVIFIGCHSGDQVTNNWTVPAPGIPIIQIDIDGRECGRNYPNTTAVVGDPSVAVQNLLAATGSERPGWREWADTAGQRYRDWRASLLAECCSDATPLRVERLCHELGECLPEDAVLVADTGYSGIWTGTLVDLKHPGQTYLRAAGSLGWSFPAALGAKCAVPERPVVCFSGDGAFYYHLSELETARRRDIPVVLVINNNSAFAQGLPKVRALYQASAGNADETICFGPTNFADIARAFGVEGIRVEQPGELRPALERALAMNAPVVVDVVTDADVRAPEAWSPPV